MSLLQIGHFTSQTLMLEANDRLRDHEVHSLNTYQRD